MADIKIKKNVPELLAPAGNLEKLKTALIYGADAVYFGLPGFSLRARASQFGREDILAGAKFCREQGKKFYIALNIYAHNVHIDNLKPQLEFIKKIKPDGIILSDPGILRVVKKKLPKIEIHISTQANVTNKEAAKFWRDQGAKRIILAREVSLREIKEIKKAVPEVELECFVHGAMCMAYSGRCILSKWMLNRSANLGDCAQSCRWKYHGNSKFGKFRRQNFRNSLHLPNRINSALYSIFPRTLLKFVIPNYFNLNKKNVEFKSARIIDDQDRFEIDIEEDGNGTYLFNSNDICLIEHLEELQEAGIDSFKIEGRTKSVYYTAMVIRAYRKVLDILQAGDFEQLETAIKEQKIELEKLSNRGFWKGFMFGEEPPHLFNEASKEAQSIFIGISLMSSESVNSSSREVFVHNFFKKGDIIEVVMPDEIYETKIINIKDESRAGLESAHGGQDKIFSIKFDKKIKGFFVLRKNL